MLLQFGDGLLQRGDAADGGGPGLGGTGVEGVRSSAGVVPLSYAQEMDWAMIRRTPARRAASTRARVPSVRMRALSAGLPRTAR